MIYNRYYYSLLSDKGKQAYKLLYSGIKNFEKQIEIPCGLFCDNTFDSVINAIRLDNPHIYYIDFSCYRYAVASTSVCIVFTYWYSPADVAILNTKMQTALNRMLKRINGNSELEKEKSAHDLLVTNVIYNEKAVENINKFLPRSNTLLGVLFYKSAVCEGIAKTTKMLLNLLDIKCIMVTGTASDSQGSGPHAWNIVKINGKTYHLDITWDIGLSTSRQISYKYFNVLDKKIYKDHSANVLFPKTE